MKNLVLGVSLAKTAFGKALQDGGAAIARNGTLLGAVAEERLSRIKYAGGWRLATNELLRNCGFSENEIDLVVVSTCCELENTGNLESYFSSAKVISCNHHLSHAFSVYFSSSFEETLILVLDGGGNVLDNNAKNEWWKYCREQQSYFVGLGNKVTLFGRDFESPYAAGLGEVYRAFTYFLGWKSSHDAGKLMSLAAYGNPKNLPSNSLFMLGKNGVMQSSVQYIPKQPCQMAKKALELNGIDIEPRNSHAPISKLHCDIAAWVQNELENVLLEKIEFLIKQTGFKKLCVAGGVAYNCRAMGVISNSSIVDEFYLSPASGDHGQCIGNALYGSYQLGYYPIRKAMSPYLGPRRNLCFRDIVESAAKINPHLAIRSCKSIFEIADLLINGKIGAIFRGRSEFGPRALGHRSIIAFPNNALIKWRLNFLKERDAYMPFAPVVTIDRANDYFYLSNESPYMTITVQARELTKKNLPAVVHVDGTARVQTVNEDQAPQFYSLLKAIEKLSGHPIILNTSFNLGGEPIVETVDEAIIGFEKLGLDFLWLEDFILDLQPNSKLSKDLDQNMFCKVSIKENTYLSVCLEEFDDLLCSCNLMMPKNYRSYMVLYYDYFQWLKLGKKTTTIRYKKGEIDLPIGCVLPLYYNRDFSEKAAIEYAGIVYINSFRICKFKELSDRDAIRDGFSNCSELKDTLKKIYTTVHEEELVTVYDIFLIQ